MAELMWQLIKVSESRIVLFQLELRTGRKLQNFSASYMQQFKLNTECIFIVKLS